MERKSQPRETHLPSCLSTSSPSVESTRSWWVNLLLSPLAPKPHFLPTQDSPEVGKPIIPFKPQLEVLNT